MSGGSFVASALKSIRLAAVDPATDALIDAGCLLGDSDYWATEEYGIGSIEIIKESVDEVTRYAVIVETPGEISSVLEALYVGNEMRIPVFVPGPWQTAVASHARLITR